MADELIRICETSEVEADFQIQVVTPELGAVAVYSVAGEYFVTADACTHLGASLGLEGDLDGHIIECTWHEGKFDIRTGEVLGPPCPSPIKTYPVTVKDDVIYVTDRS